MKNNSRRELIIGVTIMLVVTGAIFVVLWPIYNRMKQNSLHKSCPSNLKQVALGVFMYSQDYDDRFPQANVNDAAITLRQPFGWADALQPYLKSIQIFQCPSEITDSNSNPAETGYTDYWYNARLVGKNSSKIPHKESIFLMGEGNDGTDATNARYNLSNLPSDWRTAPYSPAHRHLDGGNYAFADGHVKWLKPEKVSNEKPNGKNTTFAIR